MDICIIEDNLALVESLEDLLENEGYGVDYFLDLGEIDDYLILNKYDLIILDLMLGNFDGLDFLKTIREEIKRPIIILTAKAGKEDELKGLELGADDYIKKPFDPDILLARIKSKLRLNENSEISYKETTFDFETGLVRKNERQIYLTSQEKKILKILFINKGRVLSKESLLSVVSDNFEQASERTIVTHIYNIRKKILEIGVDDPVENIWKEGYRWKNE
ncbi:response regulator transcription factor [uncultured Anaerococcus sp.]|uniref:response regulator transcription factor n=1 Tax=uncultured Anaerococcus sp. TaxID=293428 RepID=UPI00288A5AA3|nr:response regulator transcription factor [uncultured Anaerococcus sp.]